MPQDQSDAFSGLLRLKLRFSVLVLRTEVSYLLCVFGLNTLEVRGLLKNLEEMNGHFMQLSAEQSLA